MLYDFAVSLTDKISRPAKDGATSTRDLTKSLQDLKVAQAQLARAKTLGDVEGYRKFSALVASGTRRVYELQNAASAAAPPVASMAGALGALGAAGVAAAGVLATLTYRAASMGIEFSQLRERTVTAFQALGDGSAGSGERTLAMIDSLSGPLAKTRGELAAWARQLEAAGITDLGELREQLKATASAQALLGDEGAAKYTALARKIKAAADAHQPLKLGAKALATLAQTGANANDVAAQLGITTAQLGAKLKAGYKDAAQFGDALHAAVVKKGRGPLAALGLDMDTLKKRAGDLIGRLFEGVDASPFTRQIRLMVDQLDQGTQSGRTLKTILTGGLNSIFKAAGEATHAITLFGLKTINAGLRIYIALKPVGDTLSKIAKFAGSVGIDGTGGRQGLRLGGVGVDASKVGGGGRDRPLARSLDSGHATGVQAGVGFANGLAGTAGLAERAGAAVAQGAVDGISKRLVIRSPSQVTGKQGEQTATGFAGGLDRGRPSVERASARLASAPVTATRGAVGNTTNSRSSVINVGGIHIHGGGGGEPASQLMESGVALLFERFALQQGL